MNSRELHFGSVLDQATQGMVTGKERSNSLLSGCWYQVSKFLGLTKRSAWPRGWRRYVGTILCAAGPSSGPFLD